MARLAARPRDAGGRARRPCSATSPTRASPTTGSRRASTARTARYIVRTDGPDGRLADFEVALGLRRDAAAAVPRCALPGGRYQALSDRLGQPAEGARADSAGSTCTRTRRWTTATCCTGRSCRRTGTRSARSATRPTCARATAGRRAGSRRPSPRSTSSCEACHGPGSRHVAGRERRRRAGVRRRASPGLIVRFTERRSRDVGDGRGARDREADEVPRHALRGRDLRALPRAARRCSREDYRPGGLLAETHRPALLEDGALLRRRPDAGRGLQLGLVPPEPDVRGRRHLLRLPRRRTTLKVQGRRRDDVCSSCHQPERFATRDAPLPPREGQGRLVRGLPHAHGDLHGRRPAPRPLLPRAPARPDRRARPRRRAERLQRLPQGPHARSGPRRAVRRWYPKGRQDDAALRRGAPRRRAPSSRAPSAALLAGRARPEAAAASCAPPRCRSCAPYLGPSRSPRSQKARRATSDPLVRLGAATALDALPAAERVRIGVAAPVGPGAGGARRGGRPRSPTCPTPSSRPRQRAAFDRALDDFFLAQRTNAERPESHVNLGIVYVKRGRPARPRGAPTRRRCASRPGSCPPT